MPVGGVTSGADGFGRRVRGRAGLLAILLVAALVADAVLFKGRLRSELRLEAALQEPIYPDVLARQARDAAQRMVRDSLRP